MMVAWAGLGAIEMERSGCIRRVSLVELLGFSDESDGVNGEM